MQQLSNEETKLLEDNSVSLNPYHNRKICEKFMSLLNWYHHNGLSTSDTQAKRNNKMIELLEYDPNYYVVHEYKTAVWGLSVKGKRIILYLSIRGLDIQTETELNEQETDQLINSLLAVLCK